LDLFESSLGKKLSFLKDFGVRRCLLEGEYGQFLGVNPKRLSTSQLDREVDKPEAGTEGVSCCVQLGIMSAIGSFFFVLGEQQI